MRPYKVNNIWIDLDEVVAISDVVIVNSALFKIAVLMRNCHEPFRIDLTSDADSSNKIHKHLVDTWKNKSGEPDIKVDLPEGIELNEAKSK